MAELFGVQPPAISKHLNNIYEDGELQESATISILEIVQNEGGRQIKRKTQFYNLDAIISVGYRINSARATHFRIWATNTLREYIIKGFVMDDERLKQGKTTGNKSLTFSPSVASIMTKIRKLRANFTQWCKTNSTTPSPARLPQKLSPQIRRGCGEELSRGKRHQAPRACIERLIEDEQSFTMAQFSESVDAFLNFNKYDILVGNGQISKATADEKAKLEYDEFNKTQKIDSDFDKEVRKMLANS